MRRMSVSNGAVSGTRLASIVTVRIMVHWVLIDEGRMVPVVLYPRLVGTWGSPPCSPPSRATRIANDIAR